MKSWSSGALVSFLALSVGVLACCHEHLPPPTSQAGTARVPRGILRIEAQSPESLDPAVSKSYWESEIVLQLFDGLLRFDHDLSIAPALAEDWQISPDGRTYIFHLRRGVRFHNRREVTAEDCVYSLTRLLKPKLGSVDAEYYSMIQGATAFQSGRASHVEGLRRIDRYTLQINLERAYAPFLYILAQQSASVVPKENVEDKAVVFGRQPVGTGPFRFREWRPSEGIVLEANTDYFEAPPRLQEIHIKTVSPLNAKENFRDFAEGRVDMAFVPSDRIAEVQANTEWVYWSRPILRFMYLGFNLNTPLAKERAFRKAICLAINRSKLLGNDPDYSVLCNLLPLSLLGSNPEQARDPYDPQAAREALRRMPGRRGQKLRLTLWHAALSEERQRLLLLLASDLNDLGIDVELKIEPSLNGLLERVYSGQTQMFLLGEVFDFPDPGAVLSRLFHSRSKGNLFAYRNVKVDRMLEEAQALVDENQRAQMYGQIERGILDDFVVAPLFQVKYSIVTRRAVQGIELGPLGFQYLPFRNVWLKPKVND